MKKTMCYLALPILASSLVLSACGSSNSSDGANKPTMPSDSQSEVGFSNSAKWQVELSKKGGDGALDYERLCYDFVNEAQGVDVECQSGNNWGIIVDNGQSPTFWTNGGVTNPNAEGAAFGLFNWDELKKWQDATHDPSAPNTSLANLYKEDTATGVFSADMDANSWFAYNLKGMHQIWPNFNVYLISQDSSQNYTPENAYALQIIGYYGGSSGSQSGHLSIRWISADYPSDVRTAEIDASQKWSYFDLENGALVDNPAANDWHIAFHRTDVKLNGGDAGSGKVGGYIAKTMSGFYDAAGNPVADAITAASADDAELLKALTSTADYKTPANASAWVLDTNSSLINPSYKTIGAWGQEVYYMDFGLYSYHPNGIKNADGLFLTPTHGLAANSQTDLNGNLPNNAALLRSGDGQSYARFYVESIQYDTKKDSDGNEVRDADGNTELDRNGSQTWTFYFDVQKAK